MIQIQEMCQVIADYRTSKGMDTTATEVWEAMPVSEDSILLLQIAYEIAIKSKS